MSTDPATAPTEQKPKPEHVPVCPYCKQPDAAWLPKDLRRGRRDTPAAVEYHCYEAHVMD